MILNPFTSWILGLLGVNPFWILYIGTIVAFVGLVLYRTDKAVTIGLVASLVKTLTEKKTRGYEITIDPGLAKSVGTVLIIIGLVLATPATDALASTVGGTLYIYNNGGAPSLYQCFPPLTFYCSNPSPGNSTNFCTSANVGTSSCSLPQNGCDGVLRAYGRCETNRVSFAYQGNTASQSLIATYSPAFSNYPQTWVDLESASVINGLPASTPYQTTYFQSGNVQTWTNMPKTNPNANPAPNEVYGDTVGQHEAAIDGTGAVQYRFGIDCAAASINSTAVLWVQFSADLSTWNNLTGASGNGDDIGIFGCTSGPMYHPGNGLPNNGLYYNIASGCAVSLCYLRVVGSGGSGAGDSPQLSSMWIELQKTSPVPVQNLISVASCNVSLLACSPTAFTKIKVFISTSFTTGSTITIVFKWYAYSATG